MNCPSCGTALPSDTKECPACGTSATPDASQNDAFHFMDFGSFPITATETTPPQIASPGQGIYGYAPQAVSIVGQQGYQSFTPPPAQISYYPTPSPPYSPGYGYAPQQPPFPAPFPIQPQLPLQKRQHRSVLTIVLVIFLACLVVVCSAFLFLVNVFNTAVTSSQNSLNSLSPSQIYSTATYGQPNVEDSLSFTDIYWGQYVSKKDGGECIMQGKDYHVIETLPNHYYFCTSLDTVGDFAFQVKMTITQGNHGGIAFRVNSDLGDYYSFQISTDGAYGLTLVHNNTSSGVKKLQQGSSASIHTGLNQTNLVTVIAQGRDFFLYANKQFLAKVSDSTLNKGNIGLLSSSDTQSTDIIFLDAQLWKL
jgi:hypothetical protein